MTEHDYKMTSIPNVSVSLWLHVYKSLGGPNMTFRLDQIIEMALTQNSTLSEYSETLHTLAC